MARKILVNLDVTNNRVVNLADGSASTDAVTLQQLQAGIRGLDWKPNVRVAGTTNISLAAPGATINGVTMASGDRVLLKDQTAGAENGIWVWTGASSALTRAVDADTGTLTAGLAVTAVEGTVDGDVVWQLTTNDPITVGTTALAFTKLGGSSATYTAGVGLSLVGSAFAVVAGSGIIADVTSTRIDPAVVTRKYAINVPSGATTATITHSLGTLDVIVQIVEVSSGAVVDADVVVATTNTVTVTFAVAPTGAQYRAIVLG